MRKHRRRIEDEKEYTNAFTAVQIPRCAELSNRAAVFSPRVCRGERFGVCPSQTRLFVLNETAGLGPN